MARAASAVVPGGHHVIVRSTNHPSIAAVAAVWHAEVPFVRPEALSDDGASSTDVVLHADASSGETGAVSTEGTVSARDHQAWIDWARILAIVAVVSIHILAPVTFRQFDSIAERVG